MAKNSNPTLADASIAAADGLSMTMAGIGNAVLAGGSGANTFTVSGWHGTGTLTGGGGSDTVAATKDANFVLTNTSLATGDGMALTLAGIGTAKLTGGALGQHLHRLGLDRGRHPDRRRRGRHRGGDEGRQLHPDQHVAGDRRRDEADPVRRSPWTP